MGDHTTEWRLEIQRNCLNLQRILDIAVNRNFTDMEAASIYGVSFFQLFNVFFIFIF
jgi:hypothetical protein